MCVIIAVTETAHVAHQSLAGIRGGNLGGYYIRLGRKERAFALCWKMRTQRSPPKMPS